MARTTENKGKVFTLGDGGVNLVSTPLHAEVGELQRGQNAIFSLDRAKRGLTKRPGLTKFNADAMSGTVLAFQSVPLPAPDDDADAGAVTPDGIGLFVFPDDTGSGSGIHSSTDGTNWSHSATTTDFDEGTAYQRAVLLHKSGGISLGPKVKGGSDPIAFQTFDGTTWADAFTLSNRTLGTGVYVPRDLYGWDQDDDSFYLLVWMNLASGSGTSHYQLVKVDKTSYAESYIGCPFALASAITGLPALTPTYISFGYAAGAVAVFNGNVYVQCAMISGTYYEGRVYTTTPIAAYDEAWTLDDSTGTPGATKAYVPIGLCGHGTQLWAGWTHQASYNTAPIFCKREAEVWSIVATGVAAGYDCFQPVYALGDTVYAWKTVDPAGTTMELWVSTDAWNSAAAVTGGTARAGYVMWTRGLRFSVNNKVYCVTAYPGTHGTYFEIWEIAAATASVVHWNNPGAGDLGGCGAAFLGSAIAPPAGTTAYELAAPDAADPVLPVAPGSVWAKASVYLSANVDITPNALVPVPWAATLYDVGPMWSAGSPDRLTVPYGGDGYYLLTLQVAWQNLSGSREMRAYLYVNGDIVAQVLSVPGGSGGNTTARYHQMRASALVKLDPGNTIQVCALVRGSSGSFAVIGGASQTYLHADRLV